MTTLKLNVALDSACSLTASDTTGFYDVSTNPTGFLPEANTDPVVFNTYKISDGYFVNFLLYNKYNVTPIQLNTLETFVHIASADVDPVYVNNFPATTYRLNQDGSYTIQRYFIISDVYYNANVGSGLFTGKNVFYTNGISLFHVVDGVPQSLLFSDFLQLVIDPVTFTGSIVSKSFVSTCYTNICYSKLMGVILNLDPNDCSSNIADLLMQRDIVYMTLETIKYLKDLNNITQIQKLLEATAVCGGVCASSLGVTSKNCGCNG